MARSEGGASPQRAVTTERRRQLPFCLAPLPVALILALAGVARLAEIAAYIGAALRALANAKIHGNATHSSISTVSEAKPALDSFPLRSMHQPGPNSLHPARSGLTNHRQSLNNAAIPFIIL